MRGVREGGGEALTGERAGRVLSREIMPARSRALRGADAVEEAEGNTGRVAIARRDGTPRGQRPRACTEAPRTGTGRSRVRLRQMRAAGRIGKSKDARR